MSLSALQIYHLELIRGPENHLEWAILYTHKKPEIMAWK